MKFKYEIINGGDVIITGAEGDIPLRLEIPSELDGRHVHSIRDGAFLGCADIVELEISSGIRVIGGSAFADCPRLRSAVIGAGVMYMGAGAFVDSPRLRHVFFEQGSALREIARSSFAGTAIKCISLPPSIQIIEDDAFYACTSLRELAIHKGLTHIGTSAFLDCYMLGQIRYFGTEAEFAEIELDEGNDIIELAEKIYGEE